MPMKPVDAAFMGALIECFAFGIYCVVFGVYTGVFHKLERSTKLTFSPLRVAIILMFMLCSASVSLDVTQQFLTYSRSPSEAVVRQLNACTSFFTFTLDFISQGVLIHRCWHVWERKVWVAVIPAFCAFASYAMGVTVVGELISAIGIPGFKNWPKWWLPLALASFIISLCVNSFVTILMVWKILSMYRQVAARVGTAGMTTTPGQKLNMGWMPWIVALLVESAIALSALQLLYVFLWHYQHPAWYILAGPLTVLYGLNSTLVIVRIATRKTIDARAHTADIQATNGPIEYTLDIQTTMGHVAHPTPSDRMWIEMDRKSHP